MSLSFGPFLTCFVAIAFLTVYFYYVIYVKKVMFNQTRLFVVVILLIFVRMMVPLNFPFTYSIYSKKILPAIIGFLYYPITENHLRVLSVFYVVWMIGSVLQLVRLLLHNVQVHKFLKNFYIGKDSSQASRLKNILEDELDLNKIEIAYVPDHEVPAILPGIKPVLILPDIQKYTDSELEQMCKHELNHYKKHDLLLIAGVNIVCCIQWWNPLIYLLKHEFKLLLELSNDYQLITLEPDFNRVKYAELIVKIAKLNQRKSHTLKLIRETNLNFVGKSKSNLLTRIHFILNSKTDKSIWNRTKLHIFVVFAIFIFTFFIVAEPTYEISEKNIDGSVEITPENTYIIQENEEFHVYVDNNYWTTITTIPEAFSEIKIYTREGDHNEQLK